jgi:membrane AbrB-like protein
MYAVETLLIAAVGAGAFRLMGFPGGLVAGSMLAVAVAALAGRPVRLPTALARASFVLVGILLGAVVTPATLSGIASWPLSLAVLVGAALAMLICTASYLHWVHGWDGLSALLGASPGSMAQALALSAELRADLRGIAIVHVMRVLLILLGVPAGLALSGSIIEPPAVGSATQSSFLGIAVLILVSSLAAFALLRLRFPGGLLFGALLGSAILHGTGLVSAALPWWLGDGAVVTLGAVAGSRFASTSPRMLLSYLGAAIGSFVVADSVAALFALLVAAMLPLRIADVVIAFAPGAQDTMMVLALALKLDPIYVGAHHLVRFLVVSLAVATAARRMGPRKLGPTEGGGQRPPRRPFGD